MLSDCYRACTELVLLLPPPPLLLAPACCLLLLMSRLLLLPLFCYAVATALSTGHLVSQQTQT